MRRQIATTKVFMKEFFAARSSLDTVLYASREENSFLLSLFSRFSFGVEKTRGIRTTNKQTSRVDGEGIYVIKKFVSFISPFALLFSGAVFCENYLCQIFAGELLPLLVKLVKNIFLLLTGFAMVSMKVLVILRIKNS